MTTEWLQCRNWEHWQTYRRDRNPPPWIKVHRRVLQDMEWSMLTDAEKGQLVSLWILAADRNGEIPGDASVLRRLLGLEQSPNIQKFKELGFLTPTGRQIDAAMTPPGRQTDAPEAEPEERRGETESEAETEGEPSRASGDAQPKQGNGASKPRTAHRFDEFWAVWPKKRDKDKARQVWTSKRLDEKADMIIHDVKERLRLDWQWRKDNGRFIPSAPTYLRNARWEDEFESEPAATNDRDKIRERAQQMAENRRRRMEGQQ